ncbi:MAG: hypothetical protein AB7G21_02400 [Dehalococcoidia bacterium]
MWRAAVEVRRYAAACALIVVVVVAVVLALPRAASAQTGTSTPPVSLTVIDFAGRVLPFEQFRAEVHDSCAPAGAPVPHLHTRTGGPAIAIDRTPVPDPAPEGCGFGPIQAGVPGATVVRLANVDPADVQAWSALTGIPLTTAAAVPDGTPVPLPSATPTAVATVPVDAPTVTTGSVWSLLVVPLVLLAGVIGAYILAGRRSRPAAAPPRERLEDYEPADGGVVRERLTRGHAGLLALPAEPPPPPLPPPDPLDESREEQPEDVAPVGAPSPVTDEAAGTDVPGSSEPRD